MGALAAVTVSARPEPKPAKLAVSRILGHKVQRDSHGRILAWNRPQQNGGYDRVLRLAWSFLETRVPADRRWGTGLPVYLVSSVYDGRTGQGSYWQHNPASLYGQFVDSLVAWHAYSGDRAAIRLVRRMLDHELAHGTTPANWAWARVPFATACGGDRDYGRCLAGMPRGFYGGIETDKVGELGFGYAQFYELTGDRRYLLAATAAADALARHVRKGDANRTPWPFRVNARTGNVLHGEDYGGMVVSPVRLFDELIRLGAGDVPGYTRARDIAWSWVLHYPLNPRSAAYQQWSGYFEDISRNQRNLNQASPTMTARYLLTHPNPGSIDPDWGAHVRDMTEWVRTFLGRGPFFGAWAIDEQRVPGRPRLCCSDDGLGSTTARWGAVNALYAERTGDPEARRRAIGSLNYATYFTDDGGRVACCGDDFANAYWFDDGYADYTRSFNWAMAALPELAPQRQDHLLGSSSVVQRVSYGRRSVGYRTFDPSGTEVLRLSFRPRAVTADGRSLAERSGLDAEGFTVVSAGGGDFVVRVRRDAARAVAIS
ncbi:MAG TPA: hypothetical protein VGN78_14845 [Solirubrobacteraceae bacterium]|nr:hypothetical protein [Solirubrobacteraceae bacterium]